MATLEEYARKSGDDPDEVRRIVDEARTDPRCHLYSSPKALMVCRIEGPVCAILIAFGEWLEELHDVAVTIGRDHGCGCLRWASGRKGMERKIRTLNLPIDVIAKVYEERI